MTYKTGRPAEVDPAGIDVSKCAGYEAAPAPLDLAALRPAADANKYSRGKLIVVAGSVDYPGAAILAAVAGQRMGAGYTEVYTAKRVRDLVRSAAPSLVVRPFSAWDFAAAVHSTQGKPCALCIGPGFVPGSRKKATLVAKILKQVRCPVLVDGGALSCLSSEDAADALALRAERGDSTLLTPHGGEAARLATVAGVQADTQEGLARALAAAWRCIVVLKGPDTYVSDGSRVVAMCEGTPALAKAGTGDVLAGMISALLAQGLDGFDAALTGTALHARAGSRSAARLSEVSVTAEDVIGAIPEVLR